jgi:hypothetical protein
VLQQSVPFLGLSTTVDAVKILPPLALFCFWYLSSGVAPLQSPLYRWWLLVFRTGFVPLQLRFVLAVLVVFVSLASVSSLWRVRRCFGVGSGLVVGCCITGFLLVCVYCLSLQIRTVW